MKQIRTDVAVVGSGIGGISAAYHCSAAGLDTVVLEAGKDFGPAMTGVNGVFALDTAFQRSKHIHEDPKKIFRALMDHANWTNDARQVSEFLRRSGPMWQWLETLGCEAEAVLAYNMDSPHTCIFLMGTSRGWRQWGKPF